MKRIIQIIFLLIFLISFVSAGNCPVSIPKTNYGDVFYNENILSGNFEIRAIIGIDVVGISEVINGKYEIDISPCSGTSGEIKFYINGIETNEKGVYSGTDDWGKSENLNLTINKIPPSSKTCGDENIQLGEECDGTNLAGRDITNCGTGWSGKISCDSNCRIDYSNCTLNSPSENGGSSSSSSSSSGSSSGGGGTSRTLTNSLPIENQSNNIINLNSEEESKTNSDLNLNRSDEKTRRGITGAVVGFVGSNFGIGIVVAILIIAVGMIVIMRRR